MKLVTIFLVITSCIIYGVQNAPVVIHPIHVQTVPLHPITHRLTSPRITSGRPPIYSSKPSWWSSTRHPKLSSTTTAPHHSLPWYSSYSSGHIVLRIFLYAFLFTVVFKLIGSICKSKKQQKSNQNKRPVVVKNKMYVATIESKREEPPPSYAGIHNV